MREIEIQLEELPIRVCLLDVRLIVEYSADEDGITYSRIARAEAKSARRNEWFPASVFLTDEIYNQHYKMIERKILAEISDREEWWKEYSRLRREFARTETGALITRYGR